MTFHHIGKAFSYAFPITLPIGFSFIALGAGLGIYAVSQGLPIWLPLLMASIIYAGSMEFITVGLLLSSFDPLGALILTFMVNGRHMFYGLSMLNRYQHLGWKKLPVIAGLVDESFAINVSVRLPDYIDAGWFYLHVTWILYVYWLIGVGLGSFLGHMLADYNLQGIEFVMPALFITLFVDLMKQNITNKHYVFGCMGLVVALLCLFFLGPKSFTLPTIICMIVLSFCFYKRGFF